MIEHVLEVGRRRAGSTVEVKSVMAGSRQ
jgi:hypothetical protein